MCAFCFFYALALNFIRFARWLVNNSLYNSAVWRPNGAPMPPEAPHPIRQPQDKTGYQISVAVHALQTRHLEVN